MWWLAVGSVSYSRSRYTITVKDFFPRDCHTEALTILLKRDSDIGPHVPNEQFLRLPLKLNGQQLYVKEHNIENSLGSLQPLWALPILSCQHNITISVRIGTMVIVLCSG